MKKMQSPFAGLKYNKGEVVDLPVQHKPRKKKAYKRNIPVVPFVLQAFNGKKWKTIYKDGKLVVSRLDAKKRNTDFGKCLKDGGFVKQMKIQIFGRDTSVEDKKFFATPIRWRRIDAVSHVR